MSKSAKISVRRVLEILDTERKKLSLMGDTLLEPGVKHSIATLAVNLTQRQLNSNLEKRR